MDISVLSTKEREDMLRTFWHYCQPDMREIIMTTHPVQYVRMAPHTRATVLRKIMIATRPDPTKP